MDGLFPAMLVALAVGLVIIFGFAWATGEFDYPASGVQPLLDACKETWYTVEATWEGDYGRIVLECK